MVTQNRGGTGEPCGSMAVGVAMFTIRVAVHTAHGPLLHLGAAVLSACVTLARTLPCTTRASRRQTP